CGFARQSQSVCIERHGAKHPGTGVDEVTAWQIPGVASALNQRLSLAGSERLHDDVCFVPHFVCRAKHCERAMRKCEQHRASPGKELRALGNLAVLDGDHLLRLAAGCRNLDDTLGRLTDQDRVAGPTHSEWKLDIGKRDGRPFTVGGNGLELTCYALHT